MAGRCVDMDGAMEQRIIALHYAGESTEAIAATVGSKRRTIARALRQAGIVLSTGHEPDPDPGPIELAEIERRKGEVRALRELLWTTGVGQSHEPKLAAIRRFEVRRVAGQLVRLAR